jgi:tellurite resistance protein TehA-like permease
MNLRDAITHLPPAYFALVMATGIVSIASHQQGFQIVAWILFWFNVAAYTVLWALTLARLAIAPRALLADLSAHRKGAGFFTIPAGTFVLGSNVLVLSNFSGVAVGLWVLGVAVWALIIYAFFWLAIIEETKPSLAEGIGGVSLVAIVATQGVAVLAVNLAAAGILPNALMQIGLLFFLLGSVLYAFILPLLFLRLLFEPLSPSDLKPPYWVSMGVEAISTLAGALLLQHAAASPLVPPLRPAIELLTLAFWVAACWWIPLLSLLGFWRYVIKRVEFSYAAAYWGMVFPLGMYTAATYVLGGLPDLAWMRWIPMWSIYIALGAWTLTALGGTGRFYRYLHSSTR